MIEALEKALRAMWLPKEVASFKPKFQTKSTIAKVCRAYHSGILTLVLGAGVSKSVALPDWRTLVEELFQSVYDDLDPTIAGKLIPLARKHGYSDPILIRHLENILNFQTYVRQILRRKLYASLDEKKTGTLITPLYNSLLKGPGGVRNVITYNFDNVLERYLKRRHRGKFTTVYSNESYPLTQDGLRIYHPHGYLPHEKDDRHGTYLAQAVVFSEIDYHAHFLDLSHWSNILQLHHFMSRVCLFVGVSITDPNLRRLLDHARAKTTGDVRHISIQRTKGDALTDYFVERDLRSLGVEVLWIRDFADIARVLSACAKK